MYQSHDAANHLDAAADYMEKHGWTQWYMADDDGSVCLLGAVVATADHRIYDGSSLDRLGAYQALRDSITEDVSVGDYNDTVLTSKAEAVQTLRDAAIKIRPDEVTFSEQ